MQWHEDAASALRAAGGSALVFSNEFVDAFPCAQLVYGQKAEWQEVMVRWPEDAEHPSEEFADWGGAVPEVGTGAPPAVGQRVEMHLSYRRWLENAVGGLKRGRWLTIDYGDVPPALYWRRPAGTLRGYCRHQRVSGFEIFQRFGQQDLTADVNFGDLQSWGESLGLRTQSFATQAEFLRRWLPPRTLKQTDAVPALNFLLDPAGAGGAFKVLEQTM